MQIKKRKKRISKNMAKQRSEKLNIAKQMPELKHSVLGKKFDVTKSDVVKWLISQPDILQYLFDHVKNVDIVYVPEYSTWVGVDHAD